jgi:hypothetical protein
MPKPVLALSTLLRVLGEAAMLELMQTDLGRYQFAHPGTEDFRQAPRRVSGQDLGWFFEGLVYGDAVLNYRAARVDEHRVTVAREGDLIIPTEVLVTFRDGSTALESWDGRDSEVTFAHLNRPVVRRAQLDSRRKVVVDVAWFDTFLPLGFLQAIATMATLILFLGATTVGLAAVSGRLGWIVAPPLAGTALLWVAPMEITRIVAVADEKRDAFRVLGQAACFAPPYYRDVAGLYGPAILLWAVLVALYTGARDRTCRPIGGSLCFRLSRSSSCSGSGCGWDAWPEE